MFLRLLQRLDHRSSLSVIQLVGLRDNLSWFLLASRVLCHLVIHLSSPLVRPVAVPVDNLLAIQPVNLLHLLPPNPRFNLLEVLHWTPLVNLRFLLRASLPHNRQRNLLVPLPLIRAVNLLLCPVVDHLHFPRIDRLTNPRECHQDYQPVSLPYTQ